MITRTRLWMIGAGLVIVLVAAGAWFLGVSPQLDAAAASRQQLAAATQQNTAGQAALGRLLAEKKNLPAYTKQLADLHRSVPQSAQTTAFLRQINADAQGAGVQVTGVTFGTPAPYAPAAAAGAATTSATAGHPAGAATGDSAGTAAGSQAGRHVVGLTSIPVSITAGGSRARLLSFVDALQHGARLYLVQAVTVTDGASSSTAGAPADATNAGDAAPGDTAKGRTETPAKQPAAPAATGTISGVIYLLPDTGGTAASAGTAAVPGAAADTAAGRAPATH